MLLTRFTDHGKGYPFIYIPPPVVLRLDIFSIFLTPSARR